MLWNLQSYFPTTVLNEKMWHFRGQNILWPSYIFQGSKPQHPGSTLLIKAATCVLLLVKRGISESKENELELIFCWWLLWECCSSETKDIGPVRRFTRRITLRFICPSCQHQPHRPMSALSAVHCILLCPHPGGVKRWCCLTSVAYIRSAGGVCGRPAGWRVLADRARLGHGSRLPLRASVAGLGGGISWRPPGCDDLPLVHSFPQRRRGGETGRGTWCRPGRGISWRPPAYSLQDESDDCLVVSCVLTCKYAIMCLCRRIRSQDSARDFY